MSKVRTADFYYGAVLSVLFNNKSNGSITPAIVEGDDDRQVYDFTTDNIQFRLFVKYRADKQQKDNDTEYQSWLFTFTENDRNEIQSYINDKDCNLIIALMCGSKNLTESEIALLDKEQIEEIIALNKTSITISRKKGERDFRISKGGGRDNSIKVKADRFKQLFGK